MTELCGILERAQQALSPQGYYDFLGRAHAEVSGRLNDPDTVSQARGIEPPRPTPEKVAGSFSRGSGV